MAYSDATDMSATGILASDIAQLGLLDILYR
jgi:hypothetical protein